MEKDKILESLKEIVSDSSDIVDEITSKTTFEDLCMDSLDIVEFIVDIEHKFNIVIKDQEFSTLKTIGNVVNLISCKLSQENIL